MNIGLFYGSSTCYTEMAAEKIRDIIGPELVTLHNLKDDAVALMEQYDVLILGIPTWDFGEIQEDWEAIWDQLDSVNFEGKIIAMYGMGDQLGYGSGSSTRSACCMTNWRQRARRLSATGLRKAMSSPAQNPSLPTASCLSGSRWMKPTSTISATSASRPGANKFWVRWPSSLADLFLRWLLHD